MKCGCLKSLPRHKGGSNLIVRNLAQVCLREERTMNVESLDALTDDMLDTIFQQVATLASEAVHMSNDHHIRLSKRDP